jgi:hypothetical protein
MEGILHSNQVAFTKETAEKWNYKTSPMPKILDTTSQQCLDVRLQLSSTIHLTRSQMLDQLTNAVASAEHWATGAPLRPEKEKVVEVIFLEPSQFLTLRSINCHSNTDTKVGNFKQLKRGRRGKE